VPHLQRARASSSALWAAVDRLTGGHARTAAWTLGGGALAACLLLATRSGPRGASAAPQAAILTVAATPGSCAVSIDGVARGDTPLPSLELSVGVHRVECAPPAGSAQAVKIVISEGTESHYQFALAQ
jgi:hypothetical protein